MDCLVPFILLLAHTMQVLGAQMRLEPKILAVLRGEEARLTCSISGPWTVMVWLLNGASVLTISKDHGLLDNHPNVTAEDRSTPQRASWTLVLKRAERNHQGSVTCDLQNVNTETATLFVQEKGGVAVSGGNRTALRGKRVVFECQATGWYPKPRLLWRVNGMEAGQAEYNVSSEVSADGLFSLTSNLSVQAAESSPVECLASVSALPEPLASSVRLTVVAEVLREEDDCTVLLAATAALSAVLLLLLLCVGLVLCYRRRRQTKSSQQEVMRFDQSESGRSSVAEATGGKVNLGYSIEGLRDAGHNDLIKEAHGQTDSVSGRKVPDVVSPSSLFLNIQSQARVELEVEGSIQSQARVELDVEGPRTVRRVTTV